MNRPIPIGGVQADVSFCLPAQRWTVWPAFENGTFASGTACDVSFVEPPLRRRLSPLARMALHVAQVCSAGAPRLRLVFGSRHGELNRTMTMLHELARDEAISPAAFGLSVHNTAAGIFSIVRKDQSPATAIAAGEETFVTTLMEAYLQFRLDPHWPVLAVYADEPLPGEYARFADPGEHGHAIACLLHADAQCSIAFAMSNEGAPAPSKEPQSIAFLRSRALGVPGRWSGARCSWSWH